MQTKSTAKQFNLLCLYRLTATFLIFLLLFCCSQEIARVEDYEKQQEFYTKQYAGFTSIEQLKAEVDSLLLYRIENRGDVTGEIRTHVLINTIVKYKDSHPVESVRLLLLLYQYSGSHDGESLSEILTEWFYIDPAIVISALTGIEDQLMPGFRNEDFMQLLYYSSCNFPYSVTESDFFDYEKESKQMSDRLLKLQTEENKEVIEYLLDNIFRF